jgi:hypothetical protein
MASTVERPQTQRISIEQHSAIGLLWFGGWLFTMGVLHLSFGKAVLAVLIWPFYLGVALTPLLKP